MPARKPKAPDSPPLDRLAAIRGATLSLDEDRGDYVATLEEGHLPGPRVLASPELAKMQQTARKVAEKRPSAPLLEVGLRFETVKCLTPGLFRLLCHAHGSPLAHTLLPPVSSLITLRSYTVLLNSLSMPFALNEPVTDQQPDESYDEYALFRAYLVQFQIMPWKEGERRARSTKRLKSIFEQEHSGNTHGFVTVPLSHLDALARAWSWDFRATTRDTLVTLADDEASSVLLSRQSRAIQEEKNALVLSTLRASRHAIESGDPKLARNYMASFLMIFGSKGAGDFIRDMTAAPEEGGGKTTITVKGDRTSGRAAVALEWGSPEPAPMT